MLKRKINKDAFDALDAAIQGLYKADGDSFVLQVEDSGFEALKGEKTAAQQRADEAEAKLAEIAQREADAVAKAQREADKAARASGDIDALEKSWKKKYDTLQNEFNTMKEANAQTLNKLFVDGEAKRLAAEISTVPDLMTDLIAKRLIVDTSGETPITRVVDIDGRPSALSINELKQEFVDNKAFSAIIKESNASGGGADQTGDGNGVPKKLSDMTATEEVAFANSHPEAYKAMLNT